MKQAPNEPPMNRNQQDSTVESDLSTAVLDIAVVLVLTMMLLFLGPLLCSEPAILSIVVLLVLTFVIGAALHAVWGFMSQRSRGRHLRIALKDTIWGVEMAVIVLLFRSSVKTMGPLGLCCLLAGFYIQAKGICEFIDGRKEKQLRGGKDIVVGLTAMLLALVLKR